MQSNTAAKFLPIVTDEKKLELSLTDCQAIIKLSTWTENLGWCGQKTLALDAEMLDDLHRLIAAARYRLNGQQGETSKESRQSNILEFPRSS